MDENRLYYQAKNLAIELALRRFEGYFQHLQGVDMRARWSADCRGASIILTFFYKTSKKREEARYIFLDREIDRLGTTETIREIESGTYYPHKKPKIMEEVDAILSSEDFEKFAGELVGNCNYPFKYTSFSSE